MPDELITILTKAFWCGFAAMGFGILFNAPQRAFPYIFGGGVLAGLVKFGLMLSPLASGIISASFLASVAVGVASIPVAHLSHVPPVVFSVPSVIPLVPGVFAYKTMLGFIKLTQKMDDQYSQSLSDTFQNASVTLFIVLGISLGVAVPMHALRKKSVKNLNLLKRRPPQKNNNLES